jgi:hypothetical protein
VKIIIFSQSISEINQIINIIKKNQINKCYVIITGGHELYNLMKLIINKFNFKIKIFEFQCLRLINPINVFKVFYKCRISREAKNIYNIKFDEAYFFGRDNDYITPLLLSKVKVKKIKYINLYNRNPLNGKVYIKHFLLLILIKFLHFNLNIDYFVDKKFKGIVYNLKKKKFISIRGFKKTIKPFLKFNINKNNRCKTVIYFDSGEENFCKNNNFKIILDKAFKIFRKNNYKIIIKKHPIASISKSLLSFKKLKFIKEPYPIELYNLKNIDFVIGISSTSLTMVANNYSSIKVVSLIDLFEESKIFNDYKIYLKKLLINKIFYPQSLMHLNSLVIGNKQ